jgi:hypothetical protein
MTKRSDLSFIHLSFVIYRFRCSTRCRDFFFRAGGEGVRSHGECLGERTIAQHFDAIGLAHQAARGKRFRRDLRARVEFRFERAEIHDIVRQTKNILKSARVRQAANEWQLTAFEVRPNAAPCARALTFGAAAGGLALPGRNPAPHTATAMFRSFGWLEIV